MFPAPRLIITGFLVGFFVVAGWLTLTTQAQLISRTDGRALVVRADPPDWRGLLLRAALRRADELNRLRELPDTPMRTEVKPPEPSAPPPVSQPKTADLPGTTQEAAPDDTTPSIVAPANAAMPVDIGETSSTELPVARPAEPPPEPVRIKPATDAKPPAKVVRKHRRRKPKVQAAANTTATGQQNFPFPFFFNTQNNQPGQQPQPAKTRSKTRSAGNVSRPSLSDGAATTATTR
ncbi:MAG TPA: hypothetical protein VFB45_16365 [Pseudolabrys sp.]|nr:hypothetical protein [Pseudolabrys sp.]